MNAKVDAAFALIGALAAPLPCSAEPHCPGDWWFGADGGASAVTLRSDAGRKKSNDFTMAFRGGIVASPRVLLGMELGGVLLEAADLNDPSRGRGISQWLVVAQLHARRDRDGPYLKFGVGPARLWGLHAGDRSQSGWAASIAIGQEAVSTDFGALGPLLSLTSGRLHDLRYRAVTLSLNWSLR